MLPFSYVQNHQVAKFIESLNTNIRNQDDLAKEIVKNIDGKGNIIEITNLSLTATGVIKQLIILFERKNPYQLAPEMVGSLMLSETMDTLYYRCGQNPQTVTTQKIAEITTAIFEKYSNSVGGDIFIF